ncbi:MAG TPA: O-antigen ligase family protein [Fimbriimonadaceae bacterium]|nr:O-antigen ligase family protein [Fimbriimonadaceae bacterium]
MSAIALERRSEGGTTALVRFAQTGFFGLYLLSGLQAYALGPIPFDWFAQFGFIGLALTLFFLGRPLPMPYLRPYAWIVGWAVVVTAIGAGTHDFASMMPEVSTSSYPIFIGLRFLVFASFSATAYVVAWILTHGDSERLFRTLIGIGTALAIVALYIYVAPALGLPEPPRTRLGTAGGEQFTTFSYAFHRALGTFREPSHLASWILIPFFVSVGRNGVLPTIPTLLMGGALLLTGSLTGILSAAIGFLAATLLFGSKRSTGLRVSLQMSMVVAAGAVLFLVWTQVGSSESANLFEALGDRIVPILEAGGLEDTNRGYVFRYISDTGLPFFGLGLGHPNLVMTRDLNLNITGVFSNLYISTIARMGWIGLILMLYAFSQPLLGAWFGRRRANPKIIWSATAGYVAWLSIFFVLYEEPTLSFGVATALLMFAAKPEGQPSD